MSELRAYRIIFNPHHAVKWVFFFIVVVCFHNTVKAILHSFYSEGGPESSVTCTESYCYNGSLFNTMYLCILTTNLILLLSY